MNFEVLRKIVEGLHRTELAESKKELGHCIEEQEGYMKMLLELGMLVGQVGNKQELEGYRKVVLEPHIVEEREDCRTAVLGPHDVEKQVVNIQQPEDCIRELED